MTTWLGTGKMLPFFYSEGQCYRFFSPHIGAGILYSLAPYSTFREFYIIMIFKYLFKLSLQSEYYKNIYVYINSLLVFFP